MNMDWVSGQREMKRYRGMGVRPTNFKADWVAEDGSFQRAASGLEICVPTMMHSGTHLLRFEILKKQYKMEPDAEHFFDGDTDNRAYVFHLNEDQMPMVYLSMMEQLPVFTSLRHPYRIWQSYKKRAERDRLNYRHEKFCLQWNRLIDIVSKNDPFYVHVDAPEIRNDQVEKMADFLNLPLKTDWPVNAKSGSACGMHEIEVYSDPMIPQKFIDFYYETMKC